MNRKRGPVLPDAADVAADSQHADSDRLVAVLEERMRAENIRILKQDRQRQIEQFVAFVAEHAQPGSVDTLDHARRTDEDDTVRDRGEYGLESAIKFLGRTVSIGRETADGVGAAACRSG